VKDQIVALCNTIEMQKGEILTVHLPACMRAETTFFEEGLAACDAIAKPVEGEAGVEGHELSVFVGCCDQTTCRITWRQPMHRPTLQCKPLPTVVCELFLLRSDMSGFTCKDFEYVQRLPAGEAGNTL
jgi:hypothetical protein